MNRVVTQKIIYNSVHLNLLDVTNNFIIANGKYICNYTRRYKISVL